MPEPMGGGAPGMVPGVMGDPAAEMSMAGMGHVGGGGPKSPNPTESLSRVEEALGIAHQLVMSMLPQVSQWNAKLAKDLHAIGKSLVAAKMDLKKEQQQMSPPPPLGMGPGGAMGTPPSNINPGTPGGYGG